MAGQLKWKDLEVFTYIFLEAKILPEHEEILSNLKVRLRNQARFASLKILCARKVADLLPRLYAENGLNKLSSKLPKTLCSLVYQEFLQLYKDIISLTDDWRDFGADLAEKVHLFAGDGLEEFDCVILDDFSELKDDHQKLFQRLGNGSPKLRCFKDDRNVYNYNQTEEQPLLSDYYSLKTMPNLVILEINFYPVKVADLVVMCQYLPLLQRLLLFAPMNYGPSNIANDLGPAYLTNLKYLKHLTFEVDKLHHSECVRLVRDCLYLLPRVNTVATLRNEFFVPHTFYPPSCEVQGPDVVEFGLEHLVLGANSIISSYVSLPNVTRVTILEAKPLLTTSLKQFKKLRHLSFFPLDWAQLEQTLTEVGHLIKKLNLQYCTCELMQVLLLCPNLEELNCFEVTFEGSFYVSSPLKKSVRNLRVFKHEMEEVVHEHCLESCGLLHLLLTSCPELEELKIIRIKVNMPEMILIKTDMYAGALAIHKLQRISIMVDPDEKETVVMYAEFASKLCVDNCQILKEVYIEQMLIQDDELPAFNLVRKLQYFVQFKHKFREDLNF